MKKQDFMKKIEKFSKSEIADEVIKAKKELNVLYLEIRAGKSDNYSKVSIRRKDVARLLTIKSQNSGETNGK